MLLSPFVNEALRRVALSATLVMSETVIASSAISPFCIAQSSASGYSMYFGPLYPFFLPSGRRVVALDFFCVHYVAGVGSFSEIVGVDVEPYVVELFDVSIVV